MASDTYEWRSRAHPDPVDVGVALGGGAAGTTCGACDIEARAAEGTRAEAHAGFGRVDGVSELRSVGADAKRNCVWFSCLPDQ
jgi:hypothetical protein